MGACAPLEFGLYTKNFCNRYPHWCIAYCSFVRPVVATRKVKSAYGFCLFALYTFIYVMSSSYLMLLVVPFPFVLMRGESVPASTQ